MQLSQVKTQEETKSLEVQTQETQLNITQVEHKLVISQSEVQTHQTELDLTPEEQSEVSEVTCPQEPSEVSAQVAPVEPSESEAVPVESSEFLMSATPLRGLLRSSLQGHMQ